MQIIKNKIEELNQEIDGLELEMKNITSINEDFEITIHQDTDYDRPSATQSFGISCELKHKTLNWTTYLSFKIFRDDFSFSHGSGGWNDCSSEDKLNATLEMYTIMQEMIKNSEKYSLISEKIENKVKEIRELYALKKEENDKKELQDLIDEVNKTYKKVPFEISLLENGVDMFIISYKEVVKLPYTYENDGRASFKDNGSRISKKKLLEETKDLEVYILKDEV